MCSNVTLDHSCQVQFDAKLLAVMSRVSTACCGLHYVKHNFIPSTVICAECKMGYCAASCNMYVCFMLGGHCMSLFSFQSQFMVVCVRVCVCVFAVCYLALSKYFPV